VAGNALLNLINPWGSASLAGCPPAEPIFDPNACWPTAYGNLKIACLGNAVGMYFEVSNAVYAFATLGVGGDRSTFCNADSIICVNSGHWTLADESTPVTGISDYSQINVTGPEPFQAVCVESIPLTAGDSEAPYSCPPGPLGETCACCGGAVVLRGSSAPPFGYLFPWNCGCNPPYNTCASDGAGGCGDGCSPTYSFLPPSVVKIVSGS
jgi:hypothetical protein